MSTRFDTLYVELDARLGDSSNALYSVPNCKRYVNAAIAEYNARGGFRSVVDETKTVTASTVEYALPSWVTSKGAVRRVSVQQGAASTSEPYDEKSNWRVTSDISTAGVLTFKLLFDAELSETAGNKIRIEGMAVFPALSADADVTDVPAEWIYEWGAFLAHSEAAGDGSKADREFHQMEKKAHFDVAMDKLRTLLIRPPLPHHNPRNP